ncbi:nucleotidyltransferase family protein [Sediminispirochaeta bajacaliforniensis]|uniref:nucleotidyltransferase family protein n=1 Tax=Sediminispirochaeta bajacaliforniensis TaxID=148 RepID=UPI000360FA2F|nr:sugar phosphate nucleotidyltransferase [Sediminispirochaeta bajacaliforniensis]
MKPSLVILAAGLGSRYGGIKQIEPVGVNDEIILEFSLFDAIRAGFGKAIFVIREEIEKDFTKHVLPRFSSSIPCSFVFQHMDDLPEGFSLPRERKKPWGTAHAVLAARKEIAEPFAVINADDFYGRDAFKVIGDFLSQRANEEDRYCMVGYKLKNTVSEHGTVSRGICETDEKGMLTGMEEHTRLEKLSDGVMSYVPDGRELKFSGEEPVSMNLFGFTPHVLPDMERIFADFLREHIHEPKAEFYIPTVANRVVKELGASMAVLRSDAHWFGITYQEDRPAVVEAIRHLVREGVYPERLWN